MPVIRYATKNAARAAAKTFLLGTTAFGVLGSVLGVVPGAEYGAASSGVIAGGIGYLGREAQAASNDPPRGDYTTPTRSRRRTLPSTLGDTPVERSSSAFGESSAFAAAYLSAFVRALERAQMAELREQIETSRRRLDEADLYAARAAEALGDVSRRALVVADAFEADRLLRRVARERFEGTEGQRLLDTPYWEKLSHDLIAIFEESDTDPRALLDEWQDVWRPSDPVRSCATTLRLASGEAISLATSLREWGPTEESPDRPS